MSSELSPEQKSPINKMAQQQNYSKSNHQKLASQYALAAAHKVQKQIDKGQFTISQPAQRSKSLNQYSRNKSINNAESDQRDKSNKKIDQKQHKRLVHKLMKQQSEFEQRRNRQIQQMRKKQFQDLQKQQLERKQRMNSIIKQKRTLLQQKAKQRIQNQIKRQKQIKNSNISLQKLKQQKQLHQIMEQKYQNSIVFTSLEERKQKLKQRRQLSKPMSVSELRIFEKQYLLKKQQYQAELFEKRNSLAAPRYQPPKKSNKLLNILENELHQIHLREEQKQRIINDRIKRTQQYADLVKQKYKPQTYQRSATPLVEKKTLSKEQRDEKQLGNDYLKYSKLKIRRHQSSSELKSTTSINQTFQTQSKTSKYSNYLQTKDNEYYNNLRQKKLHEIMLSKQISKHQKIQLFNKQQNKLNEAINRNDQLNKLKKIENKSIDLTQVLLSSVKAKVQILQALNK